MDAVLTVRDVAGLLKLTEKTVYSMAVEAEIPAFKVRGQWRIRKVDFERWLSERVPPAGPALPVCEPITDVAAAASHSGSPAMASDRPVGDLTERISQEALHRRLVEALGPSIVRSHGAWGTKPFEIDLAAPLPQRARVYIYNATRPPGGRPLGEHKVQLIVPGQRRGERASFDNGDGRIVLLIGYAAEEDVFVLWDAGLYSDFAWSRNVQVKTETIIAASAGKLATQERLLRPRNQRPSLETVLSVKPRLLADAIVKRMDLTRQRLLRE